MSVTTNGLDTACYIVAPTIISLITLIYSSHICIKLKNGLYKNKSLGNWVIIPTKSIKTTAILVSFMMILLSLCSIIHGSLVFLSLTSDTIVGVIQMFSHIVYLIYKQIIYVHLLLRLKHSFNNNPVFRAGIPSKSAYITMKVLIATYFLISILYCSLKQFIADIDGFCFFLLVSVDIAINILLLSLYLRAIYKFKKYQYSCNYNTIVNQDNYTSNVNYEIQSQLEIMIEFRRYTVLFVIVCFINILTIIIAAITTLIIIQSNKDAHNGTNLKHLIILVVSYSKDIALLHLIYLSFKFSHSKYKKCCKCCDKLMENRCNELVTKKHKEFQLLQLTTIDCGNYYRLEDNQMEHITYTRVLNGVENHKSTGITFDDYLQHDEVEAESHPNIAKMQNAEDNVDAINFIVTE